MKEVEQTAAFNYYKHVLRFSCMMHRLGFQKKFHAVVTFVATCPISFFDCCFSNVPKVLATFSKGGFLNTCSNIFLISCALVCIKNKY